MMTTSLQFEIKSLTLNVSFPTEISFPQLLFKLKGSVRRCNLLKHCPDLVALQTPVLTQHDVFTLVADKPARLASVTICQIRCKKTNSETVTLSRQEVSCTDPPDPEGECRICTVYLGWF